MKEFTCVSCPMGCKLNAFEEESGYKITGYSCKRGLQYGLQEMEDPRRNISSTVRIQNGFLSMLPVKTSAPIPKDRIFSVMEIINNQKIEAPVSVGDVIIPNILETGVDIIATRNMACS